MKGNMKWMIALIGILLMTLVVAGGALAETRTVKANTEVWDYATPSGYFDLGTNWADWGAWYGVTEGMTVVGTNCFDKLQEDTVVEIRHRSTHYVKEDHSFISPATNYVFVWWNGGSGAGFILESDLKPVSTPTPTPVPATPTPTPTPGGGVLSQVTIGSSAAVVRRNPNNTSTQIGQIPKGTTVNVYATRTSGGVLWYQVEITTSSGMQRGWIRASDTTTGGGGGTPSGDIAYVVSGPVALRRAPNTSSSSLIKYYDTGTAVRIIERNAGNGWSKVQVIYDSDREGYMMTRYLDFAGGGSGGGGGGSTQPTYAVVNNPAPSGYVNMRKSNSLSSDILGRFYNGQQVTILEYRNDWCRVQVGNLVGYMQTNFLSFSGTGGGGGGGSTNPTSAVVNNPNPTDRLNLRAGPSTGTTSLGRYYNGTQVKILEYGSTWCYVEVQGIRGYMMTVYLSFNGNYTPPPGGGSGGGSGTQLAVVNNPVSTQKLNLRAQPTTSSTSLGQFYNGTQVTVLRYGSEWCEVRVNGIQGYMMTRYLSFSGGSGGGSGGGSSSSQYAVVKNQLAGQKLNLRAEPNMSSRVLAQYSNGTSVKVLEYGLEWCRVEVSGNRGYMMTRYLQFI